MGSRIRLWIIQITALTFLRCPRCDVTGVADACGIASAGDTGSTGDTGRTGVAGSIGGIGSIGHIGHIGSIGHIGRTVGSDDDVVHAAVLVGGHVLVWYLCCYDSNHNDTCRKGNNIFKTIQKADTKINKV